MTAADLALSLDTNVAGLALFSGAPIVVEEWAVKAQKHKALPVIITHGTRDMVLPYAAGTWVRDLLKTNGLSVQFESHQGGHELGGPAVLSKIAGFLATCLGL